MHVQDESARNSSEPFKSFWHNGTRLQRKRGEFVHGFNKACTSGMEGVNRSLQQLRLGFGKSDTFYQQYYEELHLPAAWCKVGTGLAAATSKGTVSTK